MEYLLNSSEMKACDGGTIRHFGVPSLVLMERAALAAAQEIIDSAGMSGAGQDFVGQAPGFKFGGSFFRGVGNNADPAAA